MSAIHPEIRRHAGDVLIDRAFDAIPAAALTITRAVEDRRAVLSVVRRPETNLSHPDVLCVPSQKCPLQLMHALLRGARVIPSAPSLWRLSGDIVQNSTADGSHPLCHFVDSILSRKLGLADALERRRIQYEAQVGAATKGASQAVAAGASDATERQVLMLNIAVELLAGWDEVPAETASYTHIAWLPVDSFITAARTRDVRGLPLDHTPTAIGGLCVDTTSLVLAEHI